MDLPDPDSPTRPTTSPRFKVRSTSGSTRIVDATAAVLDGQLLDLEDHVARSAGSALAMLATGTLLDAGVEDVAQRLSEGEEPDSGDAERQTRRTAPPRAPGRSS